MTAATHSAQNAVGRHAPGFGATLSSEWTKVRSVRSTWVIIFLALALSIGLSALVSFVVGLTFDEWGANEQATFDPLVNINFGLIFGAILLKVLGVITVTSEYGSRMIRTSFIVTPNRNRVLLAKALVVGATGVVLSAVMVLGMFVVSQGIFASYGMETVSLGDSEVYRFLLVYAVVGGIVYPLIPFAIAFLLRGTAAAITVSIALFFLPAMLGAAMPAWLQENVLRYSPDTAVDNLAGAIASSSLVYLSEFPAALIATAWIVGGLATVAYVLNRRDV